MFDRWTEGDDFLSGGGAAKNLSAQRKTSPVKWFGGKGRMTAKIIPLLPEAEVYVEPYAGGAWVFFRLPEPYPVEVINDLNEDLISLYRALQDRDKFEEFKHRVTWTPYSRAEFKRALDILYSHSGNDLDRAWAIFVATNQGFSGKMETEGDWGRSFVPRRIMPQQWRNKKNALLWWHERLSKVYIDRVDALQCIKYWDTEKTFFYVDPPYVLGTRKDRKFYKYEADNSHHRALVELLLSVKGKVLLSGYDNDIYRPLNGAGWKRIEFHTACDAAGRIRGSGIQGPGAAKAKVPRVEIIWLNPQAVASKRRFVPGDAESQLSLLDGKGGECGE